MITLLMVLVSVVAFATDTYKVKYVRIGSYDRGTEVICTSGKCFYSVSQRQFTSFFNSLRSGDIIEVEEYENKIIAIRKIGHEAPEGLTNGVIVENGNGYGAYGAYGAYGVGGAAVVETRNFGLSYDPYTGVNVRIGNGEKGFGAVNIPVRLTSKKNRRNSNYATVNNSGVVTAGPATQPVRTVNASDLYNLYNSNSSAVSAPARATRSNVSAPATRSNSSTRSISVSKKAENAGSVKVYSGSVAGMF